MTIAPPVRSLAGHLFASPGAASPGVASLGRLGDRDGPRWSGRTRDAVDGSDWGGARSGDPGSARGRASSSAGTDRFAVAPSWGGTVTTQPHVEWGDAELVRGVAHGDDRSLAEIYRRHGGAVYALAKRVLVDGSDAEDVTQEVFLRLWQSAERFDAARGALRTYLLTQVHSRAVDTVRSRAARRRREEAEGHATTITAYDLEREVSDFAQVKRVSDAVGRLPAPERAAIELAYFDGHTYREVAELLSEPEGTVKSRIRKGLQRMRAALAEVEIDHDRGS